MNDRTAPAQLAIHGGPPLRTAPYPAWPVHDDRERALLLEVLESGHWWATEGVKARQFEAAFGAMHGTGPCVSVTNGTHAIEVALLALGIGEGDEVIVPAWTFFATASAVLSVNAVPVLVDVEAATGCLSVAAAEAAITERTAAVIAVHIAGHPPDMDALTELCERHGLALLEDCAHAHGSTWRERPAGTIGDAGTYSFQASKLMTGGEGGAVVSRRPDVLALARSYSDCGRRPDEWFYRHFVLGANARMTEWQAAVLLAQLERFPEQQEHREANARWLDAELARVPGVHPQARDPRCTQQGHYCYVVRIDETAFGAGREPVRLALGAEGIPLTMAYPALHRIDAFREPGGLAPRHRHQRVRTPEPLPVSELLDSTTLWFRTSVLMGSRADCQDVVDAVRKVHAHAAELHP